VFRVAVRTADPGEARAGVAAVEEALDDLFDDRPEIAASFASRLRTAKPVLPLEAALLFGWEPVEAMEHQPVKDRALRMARAIDSRHIGMADSRSMPRASQGRFGGQAKDSSTNGYTQVSRRRRRIRKSPLK